MADFEVRTDLAVEEQKNISGEESGVSLREWRSQASGIRMSEVQICNAHGAKTMGKPQGIYLTLEMEPLPDREEEYRAAAAKELAVQIRRLLLRSPQCHIPGSILVTGLGNRFVTADSLGPKTVSNLCVTRHLTQRPDDKPSSRTPALSALAPGVMAQTGMETAEILRGVIRETKPGLLIVIDALAARSVTRLGTTIQLTDTGIRPGSGVGNHRHELTTESLGVPVLAIGVPTVVSAAAIVHDTIHTMLRALELQDLSLAVPPASSGKLQDRPPAISSTCSGGQNIRSAAAAFRAQSPDEQYESIRRLLEPEFGALYVTPPDIDEIVECVSCVIAEGIHHLAFCSADSASIF